MLTPEQYEWLADSTERHMQYQESEQCWAAECAREIAAAMRTPITAEALTAAGWRQNNQQFEKRIGVYVYPFRNPVLVTVRNKHAKGVTNMHDLAELVRLLGGAK